MYKKGQKLRDTNTQEVKEVLEHLYIGSLSERVNFKGGGVAYAGLDLEQYEPVGMVKGPRKPHYDKLTSEDQDAARALSAGDNDHLIVNGGLTCLYFRFGISNAHIYEQTFERFTGQDLRYVLGSRAYDRKNASNGSGIELSVRPSHYYWLGPNVNQGRVNGRISDTAYGWSLVERFPEQICRLLESLR